jgi:hypothetical protein
MEALAAVVLALAVKAPLMEGMLQDLVLAAVVEGTQELE